MSEDKDGDKVRLFSQRGNDFTSKFAKIKTASLILDGGDVVVDNQGKPSFQIRIPQLIFASLELRTTFKV